ncbi:class I SAM-dependent methyltransferase [Paracoccus ravus]|uniref:class I SAM-dependent methyltransferase n=1 Tax=Paracoccus ravus TaxID=2447760 RepID=UPI00106DF4E5|nr:class I SAM-dependent methyltransferase [Paracoccus ravus]
MQNWTLKDEIREYWSSRAPTFDLSPGHEIFSNDERGAWHALIEKHLGRGEHRKALDLASGTGVISRLLSEMGYDVTGIDFAGPMLERARQKASDLALPIRFLEADAERTMLPEQAFDVIMTRHLVWTLPDPAAAFADWFRVLKPGGRLLIVDVNTSARGARSIALRRVAALLRWIDPPATQPSRDKTTHDAIVGRVHFSEGARPEGIRDLLTEAGFTDVIIDRDHSAIRRAQARHMPLVQRIERASQDRYAIRASKP